MQRGHIPANLNFENPNPHIPFENLRLKVVAEATDWPTTGHPRRAGVSSFGFGGTNAHVVLEQDSDLVAGTATPPRSAGAVTTLGGVGQDADERVASTAAGAGRVDGRARAPAWRWPMWRTPSTITAPGKRSSPRWPPAIVSRRWPGCGHWPRARSADRVVAPHQGECRPGTVFVYSGQGSQWAGMGRQLLADEPAFAAAVAELEPVFVEQTGFSLQQVLADGEPVVGIDRIQPVLVAMQLALTALWRSYGVEPDAVIGHSMGEVTAAVVAGALTPGDGLRVIATRSRLMARLSGQGAMALLELDPKAAKALIADYPERDVGGLCLAASDR